MNHNRLRTTRIEDKHPYGIQTQIFICQGVKVTKKLRTPAAFGKDIGILYIAGFLNLFFHFHPLTNKNCKIYTIPSVT